MNKTLIVVQGPTGIGKSKLSVQLASHYQTEIISADSRQLFKELTIGTAVPTNEELSQIQHHLIQTHSIHDNYNASRFETEALEVIHNLFKKHDILIMAGGSMLYVDAVCKGIDYQPDVDPEIRHQLTNDLEKNGIEHLRHKLKKLDPDYYQQVDLMNPKRLIRALEVCLMTGKPYSSFRTETIKDRPFQILKLGLNMDRERLYQRINQRVDQMIESGLEREAREIYPYRNLNSMNTVGYKELFAYFDGEISKEKAIELIKRNTRHYARKQLTWLRKDDQIHWFEPNQESKIISFINQQLNQ